MAATAAWLASAEALLNRCIDSSAQAAAIARRLQGTALQVDIDGFTRIRASAHRGRLALLAGSDSAADAVISGSLPALLQLLKGGANRESGRSAAQIRGDAEIANRYRELFMLARPDPEDELSRWIGDLPPPRVALFARPALAVAHGTGGPPARPVASPPRRPRERARRTRRTAGENIAEYLQEEGRDLVNRTELEEFLRGVDSLRETADRIEARLARLGQHLKGAAWSGRAWS